jgi:hypothetical protein
MMRRRALDRFPKITPGFFLLIRTDDRKGAETRASEGETDSGSGGLSIHVYV